MCSVTADGGSPVRVVRIGDAESAGHAVGPQEHAGRVAEVAVAVAHFDADFGSDADVVVVRLLTEALGGVLVQDLPLSDRASILIRDLELQELDLVFLGHVVAVVVIAVRQRVLGDLRGDVTTEEVGQRQEASVRVFLGTREQQGGQQNQSAHGVLLSLKAILYIMPIHGGQLTT